MFGAHVRRHGAVGMAALTLATVGAFPAVAGGLAATADFGNRLYNGQGFDQAAAGTLFDITGANAISAAVYDQFIEDWGTDRRLNLSPWQQGFSFGGGVVQVVGTGMALNAGPNRLATSSIWSGSDPSRR